MHILPYVLIGGCINGVCCVRHAGALNVILRQKGAAVSEASVWSLSGNQGDRWCQAKINIHPSTTFQVLATPTSH